MELRESHEMRELDQSDESDGKIDDSMSDGAGSNLSPARSEGSEASAARAAQSPRSRQLTPR
jgi:hypothetical protein